MFYDSAVGFGFEGYSGGFWFNKVVMTIHIYKVACSFIMAFLNNNFSIDLS